MEPILDSKSCLVKLIEYLAVLAFSLLVFAAIGFALVFVVSLLTGGGES